MAWRSVGSTLTATAGLAINASGHPLQTSELLRVSVASDDLPALDPDGFWVVEIIPDEDTTGTENAYGAVCADPCEGVDSIAPWTRYAGPHPAAAGRPRRPGRPPRRAPQLAGVGVLRARAAQGPALAGAR